MSRLEGVSPDDCKTLRQGVARTQAARAEEDEEDPDLVRAETHLRHFLGSACGLGYYPTETGDPDFDTEDIEEWHDTVDEVEDDIVETIPDALVRDDIGFKEEAALETQKQGAVRAASRTKESLEELADQEFDGTDRNPKGPTTIVCKHPDPEEKRECIERRTDQYDDVNYTSVQT